MSQYWAIYKTVENSVKYDKKLINRTVFAKTYNEPILSNIQKSWFCPTAPPTFAPFCTFSGQKGIFPEKWQQHLKRLMVFYLHAKKYKKWLNGSKDIVIWKIEQSDWSRAFAQKSWEWEISQKQHLGQFIPFNALSIFQITLTFEPFNRFL